MLTYLTVDKLNKVQLTRFVAQAESLRLAVNILGFVFNKGNILYVCKHLTFIIMGVTHYLRPP